MNLNYKILWYDDDKDFFDSHDKEPIETEIKSWGFRPHITAVHNAQDLQQHQPYDQFDMLVVDFDLGGDEHGDQFIKDVRDQNVFAEIIFYSMKESSSLWQAVSDKQLEGIFVANKRGIDPKLIRVARQSVRKVLDIENMRGIVMSEVGDLDALLENIFVQAIDGVPEQQRNKLFAEFHKNSYKQSSKHIEALDEFLAAPSIGKLLELCDSNKRWANFRMVKKWHDVLKERHMDSDYMDAILKPRNFLAHGVGKRHAEGGWVFSHRGEDFLFNEDISQDLRRKILTYKTAFEDINQLLSRPQST